MWVKHVPEKYVALELTNGVTSPSNSSFIFKRPNLHMCCFPSMATCVFRKLITCFGYVIGKFGSQLLTVLFWMPDFSVVQNDFQNGWAPKDWTKERRRLSVCQRPGAESSKCGHHITALLIYVSFIILQRWKTKGKVNKMAIHYLSCIFSPFLNVLFGLFHMKKQEGRALVLFNLVTLVIWG